MRGSWVYQSSIEFSGFLKNSGTLWELRLLSVPGFYRVLWFFEKTLVHLGVRGSWVYQIFMVFSGFSKNLVHFGEWNSWVYQNSPDFQENLVDFSWRDGLLWKNRPIYEKCHFLFFLISFLAFDADKTPRMTSCQRILGAWKCLYELVMIRFSPSRMSWVL